jgi:long-subunit acyl-CoA synthetase (AMP-forming)
MRAGYLSPPHLVYEPVAVGRSVPTPTMKVRRSTIQEEYAHEIEEIYRR